jgi:hypothetical protein
MDHPGFQRQSDCVREDQMFVSQPLPFKLSDKELLLGAARLRCGMSILRRWVLTLGSRADRSF